MKGAGAEFNNKTRWLIEDIKLEKRKSDGRLSFTVVMMKVKGMGMISKLSGSSLWVEEYWYLVARFVEVQQRRIVAG